jgi:predicted ester cyclase
MDEIKQLIERYYYKGWNKCNEAVITQALDEHVKFRGSLEVKRTSGHEGFIKYMKQSHASLANNMCEIEDIVIDSAKGTAAVRVTCRGIHKGAFFGVEGSGHEVSWSNAAFFTFVNGKITKIWVLGDIDSVKSQLGASLDSTAF